MKTYTDIPAFLPHGISTAEESAAQFVADPIAYGQEAHKTCGSIKRIHFNQKEWLFLTGKEANEFVWTNTQLWSYEKGRPGFRDEMGSDHVTSMDGPEHRLKRKIINKAFSMSANIRFIPKFQSMLQEELATIVERGGIDFAKFWAVVLSKINFATTAQFDLPDDLIERLTIWQLELMKSVLILDKTARDYHLKSDSYLRYKDEAMNVFELLVEERLEAPDSVDDNFKLILDARKDLDQPWDIPALVNELYYITVAGVQNTTHFVNTTLRELYAHPEWMQLLLEELDAWDENPMGIAELERLKATTMEIQRLRPQVVATPLLAGQEFQYGDYTLPADTWILHMPGFLHFDEAYYPEPFSFKPERFLENGKFAPKTFGFFGGGAHVCVGRNITQLHAPMILATALKHYQFEGVDEPDVTLSGNIGGFKKSNTMRLVKR